MAGTTVSWREQLAWAAGIIDGEGSFSRIKTNWRNGVDRHWVTPRVGVSQSSTTGPPEMVVRLQELFGGKIYGPYGPRGLSTMPRWEWRVAGFEQVQAIGAMLWEWLGETKREQFADVLAQAKEARQWREQPSSISDRQQ